MIRINLLPTRPAARRAGAYWTAWGYGALVLGTSTTFGAFTWHIEQQLTQQAALVIRAEQTLAGLKRTVSAPQATLAYKRPPTHGATQIMAGSAATLLDSLTRWLPEGMKLREFSPHARGYRVRGYAPTLAHVSNYIHNLLACTDLESVHIVEFKRHTHTTGHAHHEFDIMLLVSAPRSLPETGEDRALQTPADAR